MNYYSDVPTPCNPSSITKLQNSFSVKRIKKRLQTVEFAMFEPQTITLEGCPHLRGIRGQHWSSRIYALFTDAHIPHVYILNMNTDENMIEIPFKITIELATYRIKLYVYSVLLLFFTEHRKNINITKN